MMVGKEEEEYVFESGFHVPMTDTIEYRSVFCLHSMRITDHHSTAPAPHRAARITWLRYLRVFWCCEFASDAQAASAATRARTACRIEQGGKKKIMT